REWSILLSTPVKGDTDHGYSSMAGCASLSPLRAALHQTSAAQDAPYRQPTHTPEDEESEDTGSHCAGGARWPRQNTEVTRKYPHKRHRHDRAKENSATHVVKVCVLGVGVQPWRRQDQQTIERQQWQGTESTGPGFGTATCQQHDEYQQGKQPAHA